MSIGFFNTFNQLVNQILMVSGLTSGIFLRHLILHSATKDFALRFLTRSCLLALNPLSIFDWPWNKIRNILTDSKRYSHSSDNHIVYEVGHTSEFLFGIYLKNNCLLKTPLKRANKKCKNFNIYNVVFF